MESKWLIYALFTLFLLEGLWCQRCWDQERTALLQLKPFFTKPTHLKNWERGEQNLDCCQWEGIDCNSTSGRVITLNLNYSWFEEESDDYMYTPNGFMRSENVMYLNASLFLPFVELKSLHLAGNGIAGCMENEGFHNLSKVEELILDNSILPTNFFHGIGALTSLKVLSLYGCELNGSLTLQGLSELTHLEVLDVSYNYLGGALSSCLSNLTSLLSLSLDSNKFFGDIALSPLNKLTSLQYLSLSDNHFQIPISLQPFFNHSKLKHLYAENNEFYIDTNTESLEPTFQLNTLLLSGCGDCGAIPNFLYSQHNLEYLHLSHLNLTGEFPIWLLENNTRLKTLSLVNNSLSGPIELTAHSHTSLEDLDISKNFLDGHIPMEIGASSPSLLELKISKNSLTGNIPPSIGDMESLQSLDLSHNNLSGGIPEKLTMGCSSLRLLTLSNNNLQGQIFSEKFSLFQLVELQLNGNHFSGSIPKSLSNCPDLSSIDFSNNNLSGRIPSWMGNMSYLQEIIMSNNGLEGPIPIDFCQLQYLLILDLSNNNIYRSLPSCFGPGHIVHVHLSKNRLEGSLPTQFCKSSSLVTLDLSDNQLSGNIPDCINMLGELSYLILKNNNLEGKIPFQLCKLQKLSLIDLSQNHLSGCIPSCLNLTTNELYNEDNRILSANGQFFSRLFNDTLSVGEPVHFTTKNMAYSYKGRLLTYMSGIDLSCNKLIGEIPYEIGHLSKIRVLNLSHNFLVGGIPSTFSNLKQIESLDLSYNNLSGKIPPELVELYFLSTFSVAYNNLSGKPPARIRQFATFDRSCYQGNPLLCGEPMKSCSTTSPPPMIQEGPTQRREDDGFIDMGVFYRALPIRIITVISSETTVLLMDVQIHSNPKNSQCFHSPFLDVKAQVDDEDMAVMNHIRSDDWVVMFDEHGLDIGSERFAELVGDAGSNVGNYNSLKGC
ncbi:hypothetical protein SLEP1_g1411 [Rubroshorea leprosula]|uniref:Leucine-rich repeat-containing N-terminal plant-type domain-containing protein n=1 Tax=Rubroshorea leprosula TaxID=152421 RepID=A0AAV5HDQ9_9ROSI|nr:hypothetical protein SLEP1_g1411 [Rubroshorea leprosula]